MRIKCQRDSRGHVIDALMIHYVITFCDAKTACFFRLCECDDI
jgi:hypothetical protein